MKPSVYFVASFDLTRVKIGKTTDLRIRTRDLQCMSPDPVLLVAEIDGYTHVERWLHERFEAERLHGEWFFVSDAIASLILAIQSSGRSFVSELCPDALAKDEITVAVDYAHLTLDMVQEARGRFEHGEAFASIIKRFPTVRQLDLGRAIYGVTWKQLPLLEGLPKRTQRRFTSILRPKRLRKVA